MIEDEVFDRKLELLLKRPYNELTEDEQILLDANAHYWARFVKKEEFKKEFLDLLK